jgi:hypothetical protein
VCNVGKTVNTSPITTDDEGEDVMDEGIRVPDNIITDNLLFPVWCVRRAAAPRSARISL